MTVMAKVQRPPCTLRLISDDAILADYLAGAGLPETCRGIDVIATRNASTRLTGLRGPDAVIMDRAGFDVVEPALSALPAGLPRILVADRVDMTLVRRLLAAGGTAAIPTSYERPRFLGALSLAIAGEPVLPAEMWLPCLEDRLAIGTGADAGEAGLTPRERDVLCELAAGKSNKLIAHSLGIAEPTVKMHLAHIGRKFGVVNRTQLLTRAIRQGFLPELAGAGPGPA